MFGHRRASSEDYPAESWLIRTAWCSESELQTGLTELDERVHSELFTERSKRLSL